MAVSILNTDVDLSGNTLAVCETAKTISGLWTFDRDPSAPFAVSAGSAVVTNLDADLLDGYHASEFVTGFADPNADRIVFWDDSADAYAALAVGTGLAIATTTLSLSHLGLESLTDPGADRILFWDDSESALKWLTLGTGLSISTTTLNASGGYTLQFVGMSGISGGAWSPSDGSTYYIGSSDASSPSSSQITKLVVPKAGTITAAGIALYAGTPGSNEGITIAVRQNASTDSTLSSSVLANASFQSYAVSSLAIAVAAGDTLQIKFTGPTWATNPLEIRLTVVLYIE